MDPTADINKMLKDLKLKEKVPDLKFKFVECELIEIS